MRECRLITRQGGAFPETGSEGRLLPRNGLEVGGRVYQRKQCGRKKVRLYIPIPILLQGAAAASHVRVRAWGGINIHTLCKSVRIHSRNVNTFFFPYVVCY